MGCAAETEPDDVALLELGRAKIARKGADYLVVNTCGFIERARAESLGIVPFGKSLASGLILRVEDMDVS